MTTFAELVLEIQDKVRDTQITSLIKQDINNIIRWILRKKDWSWLYNYIEFDLVAGQHTYDLPSDCDKISHISNNYGKLQYLNPNTWLDTFSSQTNYTGTPSYYTQMAKDKITFYPTPNKDEKVWLRYVKKPTFLVNDDDNLDIVIPEKYKDVIVYGTCFLIAQTQNDTTAINLYTGLFQRALQDMITDDEPLQEEGINLGINNSEFSSFLPNFKVGSITI